MTCEDYPCCGHGPPPMGDGGGCPDSEGRFNCVTCGRKMDKGASSAICGSCRSNPRTFMEPDEFGMMDEEDYNGRYQQLCDPW